MTSGLALYSCRTGPGRLSYGLPSRGLVAEISYAMAVGGIPVRCMDASTITKTPSPDHNG